MLKMSHQISGEKITFANIPSPGKRKQKTMANATSDNIVNIFLADVGSDGFLPCLSR
jgi:hypothetical protein